MYLYADLTMWVVLAMALGSAFAATVSLVFMKTPLTHVSLPIICPNTKSSATAEVLCNREMKVVGCSAEPWAVNGGCAEACLRDPATAARCRALQEEILNQHARTEVLA